MTTSPNDDPADGWFGESVAAAYDDDSDDRFGPTHLDPVVTFLAGLAADGPALEFAIGTGRVAVPLLARGVPVHGIDLSRAMVTRLRAKPRGVDVPVTIGDYSTTVVSPPAFSLVYLVFNTIGNLTTQDAQVACFANAAAHLRPGGVFVIETGVPGLRDLPRGRTVVPFDAGATYAFDTYDTSTQFLSSTYVHVDPATGQGSVRSIPFRYTWPAELDLMARLAGLTLRERYEDWARTPFTHESRSHVSVWQKP